MKQIIIILAVLLTYITAGQAQVGFGKYSNPDNKFYLVSEFGMGRSTLLNNKDYPQDTSTGVADRNGFSVYLNFGFMYNLNSKWAIGLHQKISHSNFHHSVGLPILGLRGRLSYHLRDIELNISPGFGFAGRGIDIESTISWKDHIGIFTRYETYPAPYSKNLDLAKVYSVGIFTKGKKGFIVSTITTIVASVILGSI